jgi:hypothetical protein
MLFFVQQRKEIGGENMSEQVLQAVAIQKSLGLSKQDALKVLVFITGMQAGKELHLGEKAAKGKQCDRVS